VEALPERAAHLPQRGELLGLLDALADDPQPEVVAELDDGASDRRPAAVGAEALDERARQLEDVEREAVEVLQRRVARAERARR
jgi:hypothetical protein